MGSQHARVGDDLAAAAVQLRSPAGDPLRAPAVRPPPRPGGRSLMTAPSTLVTTGDPGHAVAEHNPVAAFPHDSRGGISNPILRMLLFICSGGRFFSGRFAGDFSVRAASVPW